MISHRVMAEFAWLIQLHSGQMIWAAGEAASEIELFSLHITHLCSPGTM